AGSINSGARYQLPPSNQRRGKPYGVPSCRNPLASTAATCRHSTLKKRCNFFVVLEGSKFFSLQGLYHIIDYLLKIRRPFLIGTINRGGNNDDMYVGPVC